MNVAAAEQKLIYVADPMCSWCWGFAPVVTALQQEFGEQVSLQLRVGGLRPSDRAQIVDEGMKSYLRHHWDAVHAQTGQPFDHSFFEREGFVYNTDPGCRAVVTVRKQWPGKELGYFHAIQEAYYAHNRDITSPGVLQEVAVACGLEGETFGKVYHSPETEEETLQDYAVSRKLGVTGFPSLLLVQGERGFMLTQGYQPYEVVQRQLTALL